MKVLAADDEPSILLQYQLILSERGHQVTCTDNGLACLEAYRNALSSQISRPPFDLVLLDYRMPKLDGLAVAKEILNICPGQRIMFASAYVIETLRDSAKDLGQIVELLQKPFGLDYMMEIIEDSDVYRQLAALNVKVRELKKHDLSLSQLVDLLAGVKKLQSMAASAR
jgi:CheY-like chemotaxis protein